MAATTPEDSGGFTLIELVVVVAILPLVVGGIAVALISVFSLQHSVTNRVSDSNDALVASSTFNRDAQSAQMITTDPNPTDAVAPGAPACGTSTQHQVLGLEWGAPPAAGQSANYQTVVSYVTDQVADPQSNTTIYALDRQVCTNGPSATGYTTQRVSSDIGSPVVTFSPQSSLYLSSTEWIPTLGLQSPITINVDEPGADFASAGSNDPNHSDNFKFSLVGLPGAFTSSGPAPDPSDIPIGGCSFASAGPNSFYANQLCFVDFTNFPTATKDPSYCTVSPTAVEMTIAITGTADTLKFCISYSGVATMVPHPIPTYYSAGSSEAFLGNNGFYTGVAGDPALYQVGPSGKPTNGGYSTVYLTNVQLFDSSDEPASGWTLVTGDAESTDAHEWMDFASNLNWSVLPNNGASNLWGNACSNALNTSNNSSGAFAWTSATPPGVSNVPDPGDILASPPQAGSLPSPANATTLNVNPTTFSTGANSILCESDMSLNHTGTMMLSAPQPSGSMTPQTLTVTMYGTGLEAMFLAVLL